MQLFQGERILHCETSQTFIGITEERLKNLRFHYKLWWGVGCHVYKAFLSLSTLFCSTTPNCPYPKAGPSLTLIPVPYICPPFCSPRFPALFSGSLIALTIHSQYHFSTRKTPHLISTRSFLSGLSSSPALSWTAFRWTLHHSLHHHSHIHLLPPAIFPNS